MNAVESRHFSSSGSRYSAYDDSRAHDQYSHRHSHRRSSPRRHRSPSPRRHRSPHKDRVNSDTSKKRPASPKVAEIKKARCDFEPVPPVPPTPQQPVPVEDLEDQNEERLIEEQRARRRALAAQVTTITSAVAAPPSLPVKATAVEVESLPAVAPEPAAPAAAPELDMFSDDISAGGSELMPAGALALGTQQLDTFQDADEYMLLPAGLRLGPNRKFAVKNTLGKGMFAMVVAANALTDDGTASADEVAIKVFRSNALIRRQGLREMNFLNQIIETDPLDRCHLLRLQSHFDEGAQKHLCLVFERLEMNARELMLKHGRQVGLAAPLVSALGHQVLHALVCLRTMRVIHADLKPDNILVDTRRDLFVRLADFNSALSVNEVSLTSELQSRFYRAPEVMLGAHSQIDYAIDMWSLGCTLYELYTGRVLFPGRDNFNNHMLYLIQQLRGALPKRLVSAGSFSAHHFDCEGNFLLIVDDPSRKTTYARPIHFAPSTPTTSINAMLNQICASGPAPTEVDRLFAEFLDRCLQLDPKLRITAEEALVHPFMLFWKKATATHATQSSL